MLALTVTLGGCSKEEPGSSTGASLSEYLEFESPESQIEWSRNRHFAVEALVAACAANDGFDYTPAAFNEALVPVQPSTRAAFEERGYGRFHRYRLASASGEAAGGLDQAERELPGDEFVAMIEVVDRCYWESWEQINQVWAEPRHAIQEALNDLNALIEADERTIALDQRWSACMAEGGWVVDRPQEVLALSERLIPEPQTEDGMDEALAKEAEIAVADFDCKQPLADEYLEVRADHEREFIEKNQAALLAIRTEIERVELSDD